MNELPYNEEGSLMNQGAGSPIALTKPFQIKATKAGRET